jgi:uncharacterized oxidoreductase
MKIGGNTILITGATSGIGLEFVRQFLAAGNVVIATGRDETKLASLLVRFPAVHVVKSDVSRPADIAALVKLVAARFPGLNVLINNAGVMRTINLHDDDWTLEDLTNEIDVNLHGPIRMSKAFLPLLKIQPSAAIVNVTSGLAFVPLPTSPIYCATKAGLHSFTLSLRVQLKHTRVRVFEVAPPATATGLLATMDQEDMKTVEMMNVADMVGVAIRGLETDRLEIRPGHANNLKFLSRLAPQFILNQLSRPVDRMLSRP